ncbi:Flp pilus assembly protein CpaB [Trinickia fusca]|uniref:Flp pilus assembly protein CpaB n=1 Tax=Trinickia fusca TaxID=2419777 RepID=A0A494XE35_9BURK|nr:Flp pilus assembly protein CpaB [Trinickia fusca]RKP49047.1 Flp pilus assembly protein CpaB [Trinickia fusca]
MQNTLKLAALVVIAAIGAFVLRALFVAASRPGPAIPPAMERVRAASANLPDGLLLRDSDLVWKSMPRSQVPPGALTERQVLASADLDLKGDLLRHAVRAGSPLGASDVISPNSPGFLAAALQPGMRAISVAIDDVSGNAGLIEPGDFVDVLLTQQLRSQAGLPPAPERAVESETIVEHVRVLAVGSAFHRPKDDAAAPNTRARTVTFEVTPHGAEVVTVAAHLGSLSLALRSFATRDRTMPEPMTAAEPHTPPVWAGDVSRALRAAPAATEPSTKHLHAGAGSRPVVVYRGSKQSDSFGTDSSGLPTGSTGSTPPLPLGVPTAAPAPAHPAA